MLIKIETKVLQGFPIKVSGMVHRYNGMPDAELIVRDIIYRNLEGRKIDFLCEKLTATDKEQIELALCKRYREIERGIKLLTK